MPFPSRSPITTLLRQRLYDLESPACLTPATGIFRGDVIAEGDQHIPPLPLQTVTAAVLVPVVDRPEPGLILTTRNANMRSHAGQVAFPGGRIDPTDESPTAAALREAEEEIGLDPNAVELIGVSDPYSTVTGFEVLPVVGIVPPDQSYRLSPDEVADMFEIPLAVALDPARHHRREVIWEGRMRHYYEIDWQGRRIWGATAGMIVNLARLIG